MEQKQTKILDAPVVVIRPGLNFYLQLGDHLFMVVGREDRKGIIVSRVGSMVYSDSESMTVIWN